MKIKEVQIKNFKRFTNLKIEGIPETAKLVVLVGPNGCGKTSLFEAFNHWYKLRGFSSAGNYDYYVKQSGEHNSNQSNWYHDKVSIQFFESQTLDQERIKGCFYFRSAYRNEPSFITSSLKRQNDPSKQIDHETLMLTDAVVSSNYQRLISSTLSGVFDEKNNTKTVENLRNELIGKIQKSLKNVFEDLELSSIGDPLLNGSFYFTKGTSKDFSYANLSAGEKSAFDLLLDLIIKSIYYKNTVFCIDEPESHMHTALQSKLLNELYALISENSQLWISTHSMGMLKKAKEIEESNPGTVVFLDFDNVDFDSDVMMKPSGIDSTMWKRFLDLAFGDLSTLIAPSTIVFCEGNPSGGKKANFDENVYNQIFEKEFPDVRFCSVGSCSELEDANNVSMKIISKMLANSQIIKIVDHDDKNDADVRECYEKGIKVLSKRHIECYLFDDELIEKLCKNNNQEDKAEILKNKKSELLQESHENRGNPLDDVKSIVGPLYNECKRVLKLTRCGNDAYSFMKNTMVPLITEETMVYQELKRDIFG